MIREILLDHFYQLMYLLLLIPETRNLVKFLVPGINWCVDFMDTMPAVSDRTACHSPDFLA